MKSLLFLLFLLFLMILVLGAFFSIFVFLFDVVKWKDREERITVEPSNIIEKIHESLSESSLSESSKEVNSDAVQSGKSDTSAFFDSWS